MITLALQIQFRTSCYQLKTSPIGITLTNRETEKKSHFHLACKHTSFNDGKTPIVNSYRQCKKKRLCKLNLANT